MTDTYTMGFQKGYLNGPCVIPSDWSEADKAAYREGHKQGKETRVKTDRGPVALRA